MLALKLVLVPGFLLLLSLAAKRWGPGVAGWLAGLPVVAGPILYFIALEQGHGFAATAATGALAAVCATVTFIVAYGHSAQRAPWPVALGVSLGAWLGAAFLVARAPASVGVSLALAVTALAATPHIVPKASFRSTGRAMSRRELAARMAAGAMLTLGVTVAAGALGPRWSGLLAVFPVLASVLAVFSHRAQGAMFATALLRAMAAGMYSLSAFCFVLAIALPRLGTPGAFALAIGATAVVQAATRGRQGMSTP
jgi:hypothetical protein